MYCENEDEFQAKGEGSRWRHGEKDEGHVSPFARSKTMFYDYTRASLRLRTTIETLEKIEERGKGWRGIGGAE